MSEHYLHLFPAEEPDNPTWLDEWDWDIIHPVDCPMTRRFEETDWRFINHGGYIYTYDCGIGWEIEHVGVDAFYPQKEWPRPEPGSSLKIPIEHLVEAHRLPEGTEYSTYIVQKEI